MLRSLHTLARMRNRGALMSRIKSALSIVCLRVRESRTAFAFRLSALAVVWALVPAHAAPQPDARELADMELEQLARIPVTSVTLREQRLSEAAAAIYVIPAEEIRRSGATSLPEALRLAPNLQV